MVAIDNQDWRACFLWLMLCFLIDSLDGTFARMFRVEEVLPYMDGKTIDFVIDFMSYAIVPTFFFYKANMVDGYFMHISLAVMLLSSALYYGKKGMVEDEQYFVGFPVLWNFVVYFQFFICGNDHLINFLSVLFFGVLHFVPLRFAYPSRTKKYFWSHLIISVLGLIGAAVVLWQYPTNVAWAKSAVIIGGVYFSAFALFDTFKSNQGEPIGSF